MRTLVVLYLVLIHLVLGFSVYNNMANTTEAERYISARRNLLRVADQSKPPDSIVFLGDSLTESLPVAVNYGIGWSTTKDLNERIGDYDFSTVRQVVLMIGTNDATLHKTPEPLNLPDAPTLWYAAPPVDERFGVNDAIQKMNEGFKVQCSQHPQCKFIDLGVLPLSDDGIHLSKEGNDIWLHSLRYNVRS